MRGGVTVLSSSQLPTADAIKSIEQPDAHTAKCWTWQSPQQLKDHVTTAHARLCEKLGVVGNVENSASDLATEPAAQAPDVVFWKLGAPPALTPPCCEVR